MRGLAGGEDVRGDDFGEQGRMRIALFRLQGEGGKLGKGVVAQRVDGKRVVE